MKGTRFALGLLAASLLTACGGGGGSGSTPTSQTTNTQLTGTASKGVLNNAIVTAYALSNGAKGGALGTTRTGTDGRYTLNLNGHSGPVLIELTVDGSTQMTCDAPTGCGSTPFGSTSAPAVGFTLQSVVAQSGGTVQAAITPFTHLAAKLAQSRSGGLNADNIGSALNQVADLFDLPPLATTQPVDITATNLGSDVNAQRYAVLNAAIAQLAGGDPAQIGPKLSALASELTAHNGQLLGSTDTAGTIDLADVLDAARDVATSTAVASKLDSLVNVVINESLTSASALGNTTTSASGTTSGSSTDLDKVKGFIGQAHDLVQSILQADNDNVTAEVTDKLSTITLLQQNDKTDKEVARLGESLRAAHLLMLHLLAEHQANDSVTALGPIAANTFLDEAYPNENNYYGSYYRVSAGDNFTASLDTSTNTVTLSGYLTISTYFSRYNWGTNGGSYTQEHVGNDMTFTATNLKLSHPALTSANTTFTFGIANSGSLVSPNLKLDLSQAGNSKLVVSYPSAATLQSHVDALSNDDDGDDLAHIPSRVEALLDKATLIAKGAPSSDFSTFTGTVDLVLDKVDLPLVNGQSGTSTWPIPSVASFSGTFSSANGDKLEASASVELENDLATQALASPDAGYVRSSLYNLSVDNANGTATFSPANGYSFDSNRWGSYYQADQVRVSLPPADGSGCRRLQITGLLNNSVSYGPLSSWNYCHPNTSTLAEALATELNPENIPWWSALDSQLGIEIPDEGKYLPSIGTSLVSGSVNGVMAWSEGILTQDPTHFARGAFSATLKLKLGGSANLDTEVSVSGHRTSFTGGDIAIKLANNGKWLQVAATGSDLTTATSLTLSNQDGATVTIVPQHLGDDDDSNDEVELKLNGTTYGKLYQLAGAWVAKFNDNSFTLL